MTGQKTSKKNIELLEWICQHSELQVPTKMQIIP